MFYEKRSKEQLLRIFFSRVFFYLSIIFKKTCLFLGKFFLKEKKKLWNFFFAKAYQKKLNQGKVKKRFFIHLKIYKTKFFFEKSNSKQKKFYEKKLWKIYLSKVNKIYKKKKQDFLLGKNLNMEFFLVGRCLKCSKNLIIKSMLNSLRFKLIKNFDFLNLLEKFSPKLTTDFWCKNCNFMTKVFQKMIVRNLEGIKFFEETKSTLNINEFNNFIYATYWLRNSYENFTWFFLDFVNFFPIPKLGYYFPLSNFIIINLLFNKFSKILLNRRNKKAILYPERKSIDNLIITSIIKKYNENPDPILNFLRNRLRNTRLILIFYLKNLKKLIKI